MHLSGVRHLAYMVSFGVYKLSVVGTTVIPFLRHRNFRSLVQGVWLVGSRS